MRARSAWRALRLDTHNTHVRARSAWRALEPTTSGKLLRLDVEVLFEGAHEVRVGGAHLPEVPLAMQATHKCTKTNKIARHACETDASVPWEDVDLAAVQKKITVQSLMDIY